MSPHARRNPPPIEAAVPPYPACFGGVSRSQREAARSSSIAGGTPHQRLADRAIDIERPRVPMGTQDLGNTLGKDRTQCRLQLRSSREKENSTRAPAESWHDLDRLNGIGRHLGRLLAPEKLQQDRNALVCGLAGIQREALAERAGDDSDAIPGLEPARSRRCGRSA